MQKIYKFLNELENIEDELATVLENSADWLKIPNSLTYCKPPKDLIGTDKEYILWNIVHSIKHGFIS